MKHEFVKSDAHGAYTAVRLFYEQAWTMPISKL